MDDKRVIDDECSCQACQGGKGYSRSEIYYMLKGRNESLGVQLMTHHNLAYMMKLMKDIRCAILKGEYDVFVQNFIKIFF